MAKFRDTFKSTGLGDFDELPEIRNGEPFVVLHELGDDERDEEVGQMWHIRFTDGEEFDAFADEICTETDWYIEWTGNGDVYVRVDAPYQIE